jgi:hypothetical protein
VPRIGNFGEARARHSAAASAGTRRITSMIPSGIRIMLSRYPRTGVKSGILSIGERAKPAYGKGQALRAPRDVRVAADEVER